MGNQCYDLEPSMTKGTVRNTEFYGFFKINSRNINPGFGGFAGVGQSALKIGGKVNA